MEEAQEEELEDKEEKMVEMVILEEGQTKDKEELVLGKIRMAQVQDKTQMDKNKIQMGRVAKGHKAKDCKDKGSKAKGSKAKGNKVKVKGNSSSR